MGREGAPEALEVVAAGLLVAEVRVEARVPGRPRQRLGSEGPSAPLPLPFSLGGEGQDGGQWDARTTPLLIPTDHRPTKGNVSQRHNEGKKSRRVGKGRVGKRG